MKVVSILGSTGSIGQSTLDVLRLDRINFKVFALSCHSNIKLLAQQTIEFQPDIIVVNSANDREVILTYLEGKANPDILFGPNGHKMIVEADEVTDVVAAISGAAGLTSTYHAALKGKRILLANKESMVMAGSLIMRQAELSHGLIIPIDSEHNAIFQVLNGARDNKAIQKIILTASGGPFRNFSAEMIKAVTVEQALKHPKWSMGRKISIDSATMMNKGLEVIEASFLFQLPAEKIEVVIHPQSIVHSFVEFVDGSLLTQLGCPDMRVPISFALGYPERIPSGVQGINLTEHESLSFSNPNHALFPCLNLAYQALEAGQARCVALNAANEIAVEAFLECAIGFMQIHEVIAEVMEGVIPQTNDELDAIIDLDKNIRIRSHEIIAKRVKS
ncbi:1-deoxy-D-xylulose 5-phosphate reductoisomerase [Methylophilales bacterium HTCC2181]|uniref:1-deoxy-D-xylulose 5-phosphate reductoisomerase n=1 Tax=Methylophilales bacterium HTCC2181 TaxID=383631 RepID=A0P702_9PROT|nr:1-deoxy-D-xylulose 5-phosphate reductoisomerase [Methylophilales bacterium HTCC2181]